MSSEWTDVSLEDIADLNGGYAFKSDEYTETGHFVLRTVNITDDGRICQDGAAYVSPASAKKYERFLLKDLDTLFVMVGATLGKTGLVKAEDLPALLNQNMWVVRAKPDRVDPLFLHYAFKVISQPMCSLASGSARGFVKRDDFRQMKVRVPAIGVQRKISELLGTLDDRITLLRETNATLEAIAQALFKSWFVDFDPVHAKMQGRAPEGMDEATAALFPDSFEESELGLVPKGWEVGTLGDIFTLRNERTKPSEVTSSLPYVPIECITAKVPFLQEFKSGEEANSSLAMFHDGDILFGAMRPYFHKVCVAPFDGVTRTTVFTLQTKKQRTSGFALFLAYQDATVDYATQHSDGSTIPYAKWKGSLELMPIIFPPESVQIAFSEVVSSFVARANLNMGKAQTLATLRDNLLPRLISGQLRLPEAIDEMEEALS